MSYDLTIDRVGTLVPSPPRLKKNRRDVDDVAGRFREQAQELRDLLDKESGTILGAATDGTRGEWITSNEFDDDDDNFVDIVSKDLDRGVIPGIDGRVSPLLALMPSRRLRLSLSNIWWTVRTRATVTSCALQETTEPTKLWWTFEGIPDASASKKEASQWDAAAFLARTQSLSAIAMPILQNAYWTAFKKVTDRDPSEFPDPQGMVRVCMADADTREMAALIDTFARETAPSDIRRSANADARAAMGQFDDFVAKVAKKGGHWLPSDNSIYMSDLLRGARGVLSRQTNEKNGPMIIGFARRLGTRISRTRLPDDLRAPTRTEAYLRAISAARPLSARIAEDEAIKLGAPTKVPA